MRTEVPSSRLAIPALYGAVGALDCCDCHPCTRSGLQLVLCKGVAAVNFRRSQLWAGK